MLTDMYSVHALRLVCSPDFQADYVYQKWKQTYKA